METGRHQRYEDVVPTFLLFCLMRCDPVGSCHSQLEAVKRNTMSWSEHYWCVACLSEEVQGCGGSRDCFISACCLEHVDDRIHVV